MGLRTAAASLGLVLLLPLLLAACDDGADEKSLTIYSGRRETLVGPIIERYREESGVRVEVKYASSPQLAATLLEEGEDSPADVFFAQEPASLGAVAGLLGPLPESILSRAPEWARSSDGRWVGISGRARVVVYNTDALTEAELPDDLWGFLGPEWRGRVGWAPTSSSSQAMVTGMRALWGEERTREWLHGLRSNDVRDYANNTTAVAATAAGEGDAAFVNHYYLHQLQAQQQGRVSAANYHPRSEGPGALVMVAGAGVLADAGNRETALEFLAYLLSMEGQEYFAQEVYEYPLAGGVEAAEALVSLSAIRRPGVSMEELADLEGTQRLMRETGILP